MSKTTFEKLGITYEERDGIFYPVLVAGTEKADIDAGKYGRMWIKYIRELIRTGGNIDTSYPEDRARAIHRKATGRIIFSLLQINIVMNWGLLSCRQSTAGIRKISAGTSGKEKCQ